MGSARYIGVIDIGKTNAKYAVVDSRSWREVAVRTMPNRVLAELPYPHFDTDGIWHFLTGAMRQLQGEYPVSAMSITTHGASGVLLDRDGRLAMPVLDYEHTGPDEMADAYDRLRPSFSETGSPRLPMGLNLGAQFHWQMHAFPEAAAGVARIITYPQYWGYRFTGVTANEVTSLGCHTDLWNPWTGTFSSMVDRAGWSRLMAPVRKAGDVLGTLLPEIAEETGLAPDTPVLCGIHDSNASLYSHLKRRNAPFAVVSTGTWVICMAIGGRDIVPDPARDTLVNVNAFGETVPSARFMGGREFETLMAGRTPTCSMEDVARLVREGTMLLPSADQRSGPFPARIACWHGSEPSDEALFFAGVSLYLAMMTATCLELCGADGPSVVEGPFARNEAYLAMLKAATGRPVISSASSATGTSVGAAMLIGDAPVAPDQHEDEIDDGHLPDLSDAMARYFAKWRDLAAA